jgi:hypothetical protein
MYGNRTPNATWHTPKPEQAADKLVQSKNELCLKLTTQQGAGGANMFLCKS